MTTSLEVRSGDIFLLLLVVYAAFKTELNASVEL